MNYGTIKKFDVANGPGIRVSLFVSGCTHHCKGCFNKETWDFNYGKPITTSTIYDILEALNIDHIKGLTLLGGEPFEYANQIALLPLVKAVRTKYPQKTIWCFTGYTFDTDIADMMKKWPETSELLSYIDVLVDGKFIEEKKDLTLRFRGSSNQRLIAVQPSLQEECIVYWTDNQNNL